MQILPLILLSVSVVFCYAETFNWLVHQWLTNDMYSYGFVIPCISAYIIWSRRSVLLRIQSKPHYWGGSGLLFFGITMLIIGTKGSLLLLAELSLLVTLGGVVLLLLGQEMLKAMFFPLLYLLFMIPGWELITERLHFPLQMFSAWLGAEFLSQIGIPTYLKDTYITLPHVTIEVARACSGVNYLIAVLALAVAAGYIFLDSWYKRLFLLLGSVIISILANGARVSLIGASSYFGLITDFHGPGHIFQGLFVSIVGYAAILMWLAVLTEKSSLSRLGAAYTSDRQVPSHQLSMEVFHHRYLYLSLSLCFGLVGSYLVFAETISVPLKGSIELLPFQVAEWKGKSVPPSFTIFQELGVDNELTRSYRSDSGHEVNLYFGYYAHQEEGKKLVSYKTIELLESASFERLVQIDDSGTIQAKAVTHIEGSTTQLVMYVYLIGGKVVTNRYRAKLLIIWNMLMTGRTNGAIVLLTSNNNSSLDIEKRLQECQLFLRSIVPIIQDNLMVS